MSKQVKNKIIAVEEHFMHAPLTDYFNNGGHQPEKNKSRLFYFACCVSVVGNLSIYITSRTPPRCSM